MGRLSPCWALVVLILTQDAASCDLLSRRKAGHLASKIKRHFFNHKHQPQGRFNLLVDRQKLSHPSGVPFIFRYYLDAALMFARALRLDAKIKPQLDECGLAIQGWWRDLDGPGWIWIGLWCWIRGLEQLIPKKVKKQQKAHGLGKWWKVNRKSPRNGAFLNGKLI